MAVILGRKGGGGSSGGGPPSGAAGGDLSGTYPNPDVAIVDDGVLGSGTPAADTVLTGDRAWTDVSSLAAGLDGWIVDSAAWTRTANTTFTVTGDRTAVFSKGTRIRVTDTTVKYFVVVGSVHAAGTTTVTITGGTDYVLAANPSVTAYSYAANPQGYPGWFNYAPTWTGFSAAPAGTGKFTVFGNTCIYRLADTGGTSDTTGMTVTLPVTALDTTTFSFQAARVQNNTTFPTTPGMIGPDTVNTALTIYRDWSGAAWTASGTKGAGFTYTYQI